MGLEDLANIFGAKTIEKIYDDVASQPMKEVGKTATDIIKTFRLFTAPFQLAATYQDRLEIFLNNVRNKVPIERQIECHPMIGGPIIERLKYLEENNKLTTLFSNLLQRSIDIERVNEAHPAFIHIIDQLSPDEAYILYVLKDKEIDIIDTLDYDETNNKFDNLQIIEDGFPKNELSIPNNFQIYYSHLQSLNLIAWIIMDQEPIFNENNKQIGEKRNSKIFVTDWGKLFIKACIPEDGF